MPRYGRWLAYGLWMALVLYLSLVPSDDAPKVSLPYIDKAAHFGFYLGAVFLFLYARLDTWSMTPQKRIVFSVILGHVFLSAGVELMQMFLDMGRAAEWTDLLFNALGAVSAPFIFWFWSKKINA
ncbi:MAG: VanZ family protein [Flavobacteriaceae bacterium]